MYVSHSHKVGFVHIPKTGGTAIKQEILTHLDCRRIDRKHGPVQPLPDDYFIFSMVRDPYQRLASMYRFRRIRSRARAEFDALMPDLGAMLQLMLTDYADVSYPLCQCDFLNERVKVYRFEKFDAAVRDVCRRVGIPKRIIPREPNYHALGAYDWRGLIDRRAHEIISDVCRRDFDRFNYPLLSWGQLTAI